MVRLGIGGVKIASWDTLAIVWNKHQAGFRAEVVRTKQGKMGSFVEA